MLCNADAVNRPTSRRLAAVALASALAVTGAACSSSRHASLGPSPYKVVTTTTAPAPTIKAGQGYLALSGHYFPYKVVACLEGPAKDDPNYATRVWGVYGNGYTEGKLFTVELTQYHSDGGTKGLPTVTDTALVRMQGGSATEPVVLGLRAQRARVENSDTWLDKLDPKATDELITRVGPRYVVDGKFGPDDAQAGDPGVQRGAVQALCPTTSGGATTTAPGSTAAPTTAAP